MIAARLTSLKAAYWHNYISSENVTNLNVL